MDGFHLHDDELARLGLSQRKGAPETFDVAGYLALLRRLRTESAHTVYAPAFDRSRELAVAGAVAVRPEHKLVVTEGNYLLHDGPGWSEVHPLLDEVWFVEADEPTRLERLVERHAHHGKPRDLAERWATVSDQANADLVAATRDRADVVVLRRLSVRDSAQASAGAQRRPDHRQLERQAGEGDRLEGGVVRLHRVDGHLDVAREDPHEHRRAGQAGEPTGPRVQQARPRRRSSATPLA